MCILTLWAGTMNFFPKFKTILLMPHLRQYWSWCKIMHVETDCERNEQELCKDPRVSTVNIMQPHMVMSRLEAMSNFKKIESGEQFAISELFRHLQCAHNASSDMAGHLAFLARTLQPTQFEFILKHIVRPLVQFQIPYLCTLLCQK